MLNFTARYKRKKLRHHLTMVMLALMVIFLTELWAAYVYAYSDGYIGPTSSGSVNLSITKSSTARISGLSDMVLDWTDGAGDVVWASDLCIYSTRGNGSYTITATGSTAAGGAFLLLNGDKSIAYDVVWNDGGKDNLANNGVKLMPGQPSSMMSNASKTSASCNGSASGPTARLVINISESSLAAASEGSYSESLTLLVTPN